MWIIPKNLDVSHSVRATLESSWDLEKLSQTCERSLMWRSKPSLARTWLQRLKKISWMQHLSGRILKPSMASLFETEYTSSLAVIPVNHSATQDSEKEQTTPDTFGRIYSNTSVQLDLFGASLKTSVDTSALDSMRFSRAFEIWVTKLRQDCLRRQKLAHLTNESDCSFWATPRSAVVEESMDTIIDHQNRTGIGMSNLSAEVEINQSLKQVKEHWPTPTTGRVDQQLLPSQLKRNSLNLAMTVEKEENWPTPRTSDLEGASQNRVDGNATEFAQLREVVLRDGQPDPGNPNTSGKSRGQLNPAWVEQLIGLPQGWTNFDSWVTESFHKQQKKRLEP